MGLITKIRKRGLIESFNAAVDKISRHCCRLKSNIFGYSEYKNPTTTELIDIENALKKSGVLVEDYWVDINAFEQFKKEYPFGKSFYGGESSALFNEKILEHFIAFDMGISSINQRCIYVDVAAGNSPWVKLLREKGCHAVAVDLNVSEKYAQLPYYRVMDATQTDFLKNSIGCVSLQCAFEMFIKDDDIRLIDELKRILEPRGCAIISPLYMHTHHCGYCTPEYWHRKDLHDKKAKLYVCKKYFGIPFSRKYDPVLLRKRILNRIVDNGLNYELYVLKNGKNIDENIYCHFILKITKPLMK